MQGKNVIRTSHVVRKVQSLQALRCTLSNFAICCDADALMLRGFPWLQLSWFHEGNGEFNGGNRNSKAEFINACLVHLDNVTLFTGYHVMTTSHSMRPAFFDRYYSTVVKAVMIYQGILLHISSSCSSHMRMLIPQSNIRRCTISRANLNRSAPNLGLQS